MFKNSNCQIDPYPNTMPFLYLKKDKKVCQIMWIRIRLNFRNNFSFFVSSTHLRN